MSSVVISGDTSGAITLAAPAVSGTNTATLPAATGTVMVSGNMPAFSAYANAIQSVTNGVTTKVQFQIEDFDTNNCFDSTTNYRFTPTVAGYYQINASVRMQGTVITGYDVFLYKNGAAYQNLSTVNVNLGTTILNGSCIVYLNGSTDYVEIYADVSATSPTFSQSGTTVNTSRFSASLLRNS